MTESIAQKMVVADYAFRFDALPERVTFSKQIKISGWLLHRRGLPIHGIRGIVRGILRRRSIFRARRKRSRPLIAAAYPDLPEAGQSGFLLLLELPVGRSEITIQVQDDRKIWRKIFVTDTWAFPLTFVGRIGLPRVEQFLSTYLGQLFVGNRKNTATSLKQHSLTHIESRLPRKRIPIFKAGSTQRGIKTVDLVRHLEVESVYPRNRRLTLCRLPRGRLRNAALGGSNSGPNKRKTERFKSWLPLMSSSICF